MLGQHYNYLFAKKHQGDFILRIEDTDQARFVEGAEKYIIDSLKWCGLEIDEGPSINEHTYGPYRQSEKAIIGSMQISSFLQVMLIMLLIHQKI